jgi:hypothetical protein
MIGASAQAFGFLPGVGLRSAAAVQQHAQSSGIYPDGASTSSPVGPNPDEQFLGSKPAVASPAKATIGRHQDPWLSAAIAQGAQINASKVASTATPNASTAPDSGFQYDDAAIGAGVMAGLALIGTAGVLAVRRRGQLQRP